jgi:hypothetical protein
VARPEYNLRLQSPNSVIVHAGGAERAYFSGAGLAVDGNLYLRGRMTVQADDPWMRLNQFGHYANGVHTPWALSCGNLNVGGANSWASPGQGNLIVAGSLVVNGVARLGAGDLPVYIGGNQTGPFLRLHDDMWLADRQTGMIDVLDGQGTGWGIFRGHFREPSSREHKRAITPLAVAEQEALLAEALAAELVWFRWRDDDDGGRPRLGVIAEDAPEHLVEEDRTGLSMPEYLAVLLGAVQALHRRIAELPTGSAA